MDDLKICFSVFLHTFKNVIFVKKKINKLNLDSVQESMRLFQCIFWQGHDIFRILIASFKDFHIEIIYSGKFATLRRKIYAIKSLNSLHLRPNMKKKWFKLLDRNETFCLTLVWRARVQYGLLDFTSRVQRKIWALYDI